MTPMGRELTEERVTNGITKNTSYAHKSLRLSCNL